VAQHNVPVLDVCWGRQALSQGIRDHEMGTERHEFDDTCGHHIANEVTADINVTGELATNRIFRHGHTGQIILVDMRRSSLSIAEITKDLGGASSTIMLQPSNLGSILGTNLISKQN